MYGVTTEPALIRPIVVCHLHVQAGLQYIKQGLMNMITMMKITKMTMRIRRRMFSEDAQLQSYAVCGQRMAEPQNG